MKSMEFVIIFRVILSVTKDLAVDSVSLFYQSRARDPSVATLCQDDTIAAFHNSFVVKR